MAVTLASENDTTMTRLEIPKVASAQKKCGL
jgi:hypothetical protein